MKSFDQPSTANYNQQTFSTQYRNKNKKSKETFNSPEIVINTLSRSKITKDFGETANLFKSNKSSSPDQTQKMLDM